MQKGVRYRPGRVRLSPEVRWVLHRAFAPPDAPVEGVPSVDAADAFDIARRFDLAPRIGQRVPRRVLADDLGHTGCEIFYSSYLETSMQIAAFERVLRDIVEVAGREGIRLIVLKGMAHHLLGVTPVGSRGCGDIDLLVPLPDAVRLHHTLTENGFTEIGAHEDSHHHLSVLKHWFGLLVEIHTRLPGVRVDSDTEVSAAGLFDDSLCRRLPEVGETTHVLDEDLRMAHLVAHGIAQHAEAPHNYPFSRLVSDLADIAWSPEQWQGFLDGEGYRWISRQVSQEEVSAVAGMVESLSRGEIPETRGPEADGPTLMLRHLVAGALDPDYRRYLHGNLLVTSDGRGIHTVRGIARFLIRRWFISRREYDLRAHGRGTALGYIGFLVLRPLRLGLIAIRIGLRTARYRLRRSEFDSSSVTRIR